LCFNFQLGYMHRVSRGFLRMLRSPAPVLSTALTTLLRPFGRLTRGALRRNSWYLLRSPIQSRSVLTVEIVSTRSYHPLAFVRIGVLLSETLTKSAKRLTRQIAIGDLELRITEPRVLRHERSHCACALYAFFFIASRFGLHIYAPTFTPMTGVPSFRFSRTVKPNNFTAVSWRITYTRTARVAFLICLTTPGGRPYVPCSVTSMVMGHGA
jgi:hypothetical protein